MKKGGIAAALFILQDFDPAHHAQALATTRRLLRHKYRLAVILPPRNYSQNIG